MKVGALLFFCCAIFFAVPITPSSAIADSFLDDYWKTTENRINPKAEVSDLNILVKYSDKSKTYTDYEKSNETCISVVFEEDHYDRLKFTCQTRWEPINISIQDRIRHIHYTVDCESFQMVEYTKNKYLFILAMILVILLSLIGVLVWIKKDHIKRFVTGRYQKWRSPAVQQLYDSSEERQQQEITGF
ncbi:unnamed protein product [Caenorhabditis angaria]|uniref:Uncharacterized protein n=1 Tax=Caenorhabditis angaria TaxID=860376 RepID=A0A9P1N7H5_9PELO|nr:unnamed protein product [Caenorhabditis angaria]